MKPNFPLASSWPLMAAAAFAVVSLSMARGPQGPDTSKLNTNPTPEQLAFFETKVRPVLAEQCLPCHGQNMQMAGLRLDSVQAMLKGGDKGPSLVPGEPGRSLLITAIHQTTPLKMPKGSKLKPDVIANLEAWVAMGAPWPKSKVPEPKDTPRVLWSLQPVKNPAAPKVANASWVRDPIDAFVLARLESRKLAPQALVDRRTILRRLSYDLTGLPPTPAEVDAFLADTKPDAYDRQVDRLLASPRFGERWARHWLDIARYADTKGYVFEEDRNYPNAYTYRDWVIGAFNRDLPYDQFLVQQLAADRLPETQGDDRRALAAMGFLTVGRRFLNQTPDIIDDRIDVTMRGMQGLTVACARCHDHKFDPIPTQDYYSLYAVFNSSTEVTLPISERAVRDPWERHANQLSQAETDRRNLIFAQTNILRQVDDPSKQPAEIRTTLQMLRPETLAEGDNLRKLRPGFQPDAVKKLEELDGQIAKLKGSTPPVPEFAMAMKDSANPGDGVVFRRGNPGNPGDPAPRRFLAALSTAKEREHWSTSSGRLDMARAIASPENPLTARVWVNRVWMHLFGAGIVRTPSDFGFQGEKPTHPELLDHLATRLVRSGWSTKRLIRAIVRSSTYRQGSTASQTLFNADPENRLLGRMNRKRLDLEQMRDSLLAAAGTLDLGQVGGRSTDIWTPQSTRRSVYGFVDRQNLPGVFKTFDFASPDATTPQRFRTTVPQQALFFMNAPLVARQSQQLAARTDIAVAADEPTRIRRLYRSLFGRLPDADELAAGLAFLRVPERGGPRPLWEYGYGGYDGVAQRTTLFTPLPVFADGFYRGGPAIPDPKLGYLLLNQEGGHPGRDANHSAVRRWVSPGRFTLRITGALNHPEKQGDGVRVRIVSSRVGLLREWTALGQVVATVVEPVEVEPGEIIDFAVDPMGSDTFDGFAWAPTLETLDRSRKWEARSGFGPRTAAMNRRELYVQALLMTNEFAFVD